MIDQQAIPILQQEALQAQSASIQACPGQLHQRRFTQSLQAALHQLGVR